MIKPRHVLTLFVWSVIGCSQTDSGAREQSYCTSYGCKGIYDVANIEVDSGQVRHSFTGIKIETDLEAGLVLQPTVYFNGRIVGAPTVSTSRSRVHKSDTADLISDIAAIPVLEVEGKFELLYPNKQDFGRALGKRDLNRDDTFHLRLVSDQQYRLVVNPQGKWDLPPSFYPMKIEKPVDEKTGKEVPIDTEGTFEWELTGRVLQGKINTEGGTLDGKMQVRVFQGEVLVSSTAIVESGNTFRCRLANPLFNPAVNPTLRIRAEPLPEHRYLPVISKSFSLSDFETTELEIKQSVATATHAIKIANSDDEPVSSVDVFLHSRIGGREVSFKVKTGSDGTVNFAAIPGRYDISVYPPQNSDLGMASLDNVELASPGPPLKIKVVPSRRTPAKLVDISGIPVVSARVELRRLRSIGLSVDGTSDDNPQLLYAITGNDGRFCAESNFVTLTSGNCHDLRLDPGQYRIAISPPDGSRYAFTYIYMTMDEAGLGVPLSMKLPASHEIKSRLTAPDGRADIKRGLVKMFSTQIDEITGQPILLGQAYTDDEGQFSLWVPVE